jgi:hypothetical protein
MRTYVAHFIVLVQECWLDTEKPYVVTRTSERHRLVSQLFEATAPELAYAKASEMLNGLNDSHCDGIGDRTNYVALGIYELEEVFLGGKTVQEAIREPYGLDVGNIVLLPVTAELRPRDELAVFKRESQT